MKWVKVLLPFENYIKPEQNKTSCYRHASMKKVRHMLIKNEGQEIHCVKNVYIWKFSGPYFPAFAPYSFQMRENTNQNKDNIHAVIFLTWTILLSTSVSWSLDSTWTGKVKKMSLVKVSSNLSNRQVMSWEPHYKRNPVLSKSNSNNVTKCTNASPSEPSKLWRVKVS